MNDTFAQLSRVLGPAPAKDSESRLGADCAFSFIPFPIARNIDRSKAIALEELKPDLPGLLIQSRPQRYYPYGRLGCHVIGYLNEIDRWRLTRMADYGYKTRDIVGFGGVEEKYDYYLRQEEGGLSVEVDHRGSFVRVLGLEPAKNGKDIQLTLDLRIQKIVEKYLGEVKGCVVIIEPYTGGVLAMASRPDFDPGVFIHRSASAIAELFNNPQSPLVNRAVSGLYPPGSVFKLVVAAAALETGKINLSTTYTCTGKNRIGARDFSCWNVHHEQDLIAAIAHSCNSFFYRIGLLAGAQLIHDYALKFGLGKAISGDFLYEENGFVPSPLWRKISKFKVWFDGDTANFAIGQGDLLVTPIQIARMMAVFANRGFLVTPYVVKAIDGMDISAYQIRTSPIQIKAATLDIIRQGLRSVVSDPGGTASNLAGLEVSVAGKTGTAQVPPGQSHGWFAGFFPFKNPRFVMCVFVEHGGAGYVASGIAKQIIEEMIKENLI
jgi:penicillin-binding protein 2